MCGNHRYAPEIPDFIYRPCNSVVSHGAQFRGDSVLPTAHAKANATAFKSVHNLRVPCSFLCTFVFMLQYMQVTHSLDKPPLFWLQENLKTPQIEPNAGIKMAQVLVSLVYICGVTRSSMHYSQRLLF